MGFLYELQSQLETMNAERKDGKPVNPQHMEVIRINLPVITEYCGMKPYQGDSSYVSLYQYMKDAEKVLSKGSNVATLKADALMSSLLRSMGKEGVLKLKRDHFNTKLEDCVIGADQQHMVEVVDGHLVPRTGLIFLTPRNKMGRAPFYSSEKVLGEWHIKTLWFNMAVMGLMCIAVALLLFTDCPGRYLRKSDS